MEERGGIFPLGDSREHPTSCSGRIGARKNLVRYGIRDLISFSSMEVALQCSLQNLSIMVRARPATGGVRLFSLSSPGLGKSDF
jgi:hypothetical protein